MTEYEIEYSKTKNKCNMFKRKEFKVEYGNRRLQQVGWQKVEKEEKSIVWARASKQVRDWNGLGDSKVLSLKNIINS